MAGGIFFGTPCTQISGSLTQTKRANNQLPCCNSSANVLMRILTPVKNAYGCFKAHLNLNLRSRQHS